MKQIFNILDSRDKIIKMSQNPSRLSSGHKKSLFHLTLMIVVAFFLAVTYYQIKSLDIPPIGSLFSDKLPVSKIIISGWSGQKDNEQKISSQKIGDILESALKSSGAFAFVEPSDNDRRDYIVKLVYQGIDAPLLKAGRPDKKAPGKKSRINLELKITPKSASYEHPSYAASGFAVFDNATVPDYKKLFKKAVETALAKVTSEIKINRTGEKKLIALLQDPKAKKDKKLLAISRLGELKSKQAVDELIKLVDNGLHEKELAERSVGALSLIGDERAIDVVIKYFNIEKELQAMQAVNFITDFGGEEAIAFLSVMSTGHKSPAVRQSARASLDKLGFSRKQLLSGGSVKTSENYKTVKEKR